MFTFLIRNLMIRVLIFEDNKNLRDSLAMYLDSSEGFMMAGAFG